MIHTFKCGLYIAGIIGINIELYICNRNDSIGNRQDCERAIEIDDSGCRCVAATALCIVRGIVVYPH